VDVISEATGEIDGAVSDQGDGTFARALSKIGNEALTFVQNPSGLANQLGDLVVQAGEAAGAGPDTLQALRPIAQFGTQLAAVPLTTATRKVQALNQNAVVSLVTNSAVIEMARNVINTEFTTTDDAFATRDEIGGYLDTAMDRASEAEDDQLFETLRVLRTATTDYINAQSPRTAQVINTVAPLTEPALVTAYRLYQDASRADEIATRNGVAHPGFVPGGETIEVLSNV
jgi:prophage DNA circulation protein